MRLAHSSRLVLTDRDVELLGTLAEYRYLAVSQLERLHFPSSQTARRRLRLLAESQFVRLLEIAGLPERVVTLDGPGAELLSERTGAAVEAGGRPQHPLFLQHHLAGAEFRLRLTQSCAKRSDLRLAGFLAEHLGRSGARTPVKYLHDEIPADGGEPAIAHTPDGAFALERAGVSALFFLEIDRGTEVLSASDHGVGKIVRFYLRYLVSGRYQRYQSDFGANNEFRGFRALLVTTTRERLENIRQRCGRIPFTPPQAKRFLWLASFDLLRDGNPLRYEWVSLDPTDASHYVIAPE